MIVYADNAGPYAAKCGIEHNHLKRVSYPPYSPNLAPSDFDLFGYVKHQIQGHDLTERAELISTISKILNQIPTDTLVDVVDDWMRRLQ
jgi:hypothetical protein